MTAFAERADLMKAFATSFAIVRPSWNFSTQVNYPPIEFTEPNAEWIRVICTNQGGGNRAVRIVDEVFNLLTVDCFSPFDGDDLSTMFDVDILADDVHQALRTMTPPSGVDDVEIAPRDFPVTDTAFQHKRLTLFFRFDLPEYG